VIEWMRKVELKVAEMLINVAFARSHSDDDK